MLQETKKGLENVLGLSTPDAYSYQEAPSQTSSMPSTQAPTSFVSSINHTLMNWMSADQSNGDPVETKMFEGVKRGFSWLFGDDEDANYQQSSASYPTSSYQGSGYQGPSYQASSSQVPGYQGSNFYPNQMASTMQQYAGSPMMQQRSQSVSVPPPQTTPGLPPSMLDALNRFNQWEPIIHPLNIQ